MHIGILLQYTFEIKSGTWKHKAFTDTEEAKLESLHDLNFGHLSDGFVINRTMTSQIHTNLNNEVNNLSDDFVINRKMVSQVHNIRNNEVNHLSDGFNL